MTQLNDMKVGCIGVGNMGAAIIAGLLDTIKSDNLIVYDIDNEKLNSLSKRWGVIASETVELLVDKSNIIILAVKPDIIKSVLKSIKELLGSDKIIVSIAAGISISSIENILESSKKIIRVMPNTPSIIREGMSVLSPNELVDNNSLKIVEEIFSKIGKVLVLPEKMMDAVTGVSGSGPAYVFTFIQAMVDGGVKMGIPRDKALVLAVQTVIGAAKLVLESREDPISLRGKVTSPGGTTIDAIHVLESAGFSGIIMNAIESATLKSKILGE